MASRKSSVSSSDQLDALLKIEHKVALKKQKLYEDINNSSDALEIMKANKSSFIPEREESDKKSYIINPFDFQEQFGYKDKPTSMSYGMMRSMAQTPIINAIIRTRVSQVATFTEPQRDQYSLGYKIQKRRSFGEQEQKMTKQEYKEIELIHRFLEDCGVNKEFHSDDFDTFLRKVTRDSLTFDQMTFEVIRDRKGVPQEFYAVDASTIRIADSFDDDEYKKSQRDRNSYQEREVVSGYYPSYVQVHNSLPVADFYPWEMCFGIRNPTTNVNMNGYGISELEEMVFVITSMLWGDEYNRRFFKQGSAPKGMLRVTGNLTGNKLHQFKQEWNATMRGVYNSWKTPVLEADKAEWIDLHKNNRDMEYSNWSEYLIKIGCAMYSIDPAEVNFPLNGSSGQQSMFEGNNANRLKHSKDKGLYPILKFFQKRINKYLISQQYDGKYELVFFGLDSMSPVEQQKMDIDSVGSIETLNEVRQRRNLPKLDGGDIVLNSIFMQKQQMEAQAQMFAQGGGDEAGGGFVDEQEEGVDYSDVGSEDNPIQKALQDYLNKL